MAIEANMNFMSGLLKTRFRRTETTPIIGLAALALLVGPLATGARAQERPSPVLEFAAGWVGYPDDGLVSELVTGGAFRWYVTPRVSIGPELTFISGDNHNHFVATGNLTWDLRDGRGSVVPFVVAGGGLYSTHEEFFDDAVTSSEGAFTAGGGVRVAAGDRVTVGVEARVGWELHIRVNGLVGIRLGR